MIFTPHLLIAFSSSYLSNKYTHIIEMSFLVALISFVAGSVFINKSMKDRLYFLVLAFICFLSAYLFKDSFLHENNLFTLYLLILSISFISLGSNTYSSNIIYQTENKWQKIVFVILLVTVFISLNYLIKKPVSKLALIQCFSNWADTKTSFNMKNITVKGGYSYSLMKEMLQNKYSLISIDERKKLQDGLKNVYTALMITPTIPLKKHEKNIINQFVINGGRLVVITDHTDLYGHGRVVNSLLKEAKIKVEFNALFDPSDYFAKIRLSNMPINALRPKTPNSLNIAKPAYIWGWAQNWVSEVADYTRPNFFGEFEWTSDDSIGNWPVGATVKFGKGDIVIWCDSTIFANFCIFQKDYLKFLGNLIEGGSVLADFSVFGFWLLIFTILLLCTKFFFTHNIILYCSLILVIFSGTYYIWDTPQYDFYKDDKRIDVYGKEYLFEEPPPGRIPQKGHLSSAYSHIARSGLRPLYVGEKPKKPVLRKSIWVTTWDQANTINDEIYKSMWGIVVTDIDNNLKQLGYKVVLLKDDISEIFADLIYSGYFQRKVLVTGNNHTLSLSGVSVFAAGGVLTDRYFGDWWIITDISPYRKYMLTEWFNWLINKHDIKKYSYPKIGVSPGKDEWLIKLQKGDFYKRKMSIKPYKKNKNYIYLGSGIWALHEKNSEGEFLVGGPEISDNYLVSGSVRWAAQVLNK
jgi:hypothetical protein